jgi:Response regulators consisting of a CheY-like receiver domain and a winged-helix DNA-binding domain
MTKVKIAIVEDDEAIAQMYRIKFEAEGYIIETASNGKLGLALAEEMRPDIMLTDLMMPVMDGEEMLTRLRKTDWGKRLRSSCSPTAASKRYPTKSKTPASKPSS